MEDRMLHILEDFLNWTPAGPTNTAIVDPPAYRNNVYRLEADLSELSLASARTDAFDIATQANENDVDENRWFTDISEDYVALLQSQSQDMGATEGSRV